MEHGIRQRRGEWEALSYPASSSVAAYELAYSRVMQGLRRLTEIMLREDDGYVSLCPELDIASQGETVEEACANLIEAPAFFFEAASPAEVDHRLHTAVLVTQIEVPVG
jgi:predicted RNase H-like HicB family nuclease